MNFHEILDISRLWSSKELVEFKKVRVTVWGPG